MHRPSFLTGAAALTIALAACAPGAFAPDVSDQPVAAPPVEVHLDMSEYPEAPSDLVGLVVNDRWLPSVAWIEPGEVLAVLFQSGGGEGCVPFPDEAVQHADGSVSIRFDIAPEALVCPLPFIITTWQVELAQPLESDALAYTLSGFEGGPIDAELAIDATPVLSSE